MPITPVNQNKNISSFSGVRKGGIYTWGDPVATWGDALATWGSNYSVTNIVKNTPSSAGTEVGSPIGLLLSLTYATASAGGSGWINISKN